MTSDVMQFDELPHVPRTFNQLGLLVLDGSGSMSEQSYDKGTKAQSVSLAVKELLGKLQHSRVSKNFSIGVVTFDTSAKIHTPVTAIESVDDYADYDPLLAHGGGTDIGVAPQTAQRLAEEFLAQPDAATMPHSVVIVVMSDGMSSGDPLTIANSIKRNPKITICTTLFATVGKSEPQAEQLLKEIASSPLNYRTTYAADDLRKFFIASVSSGKNVKIE